MTWIDSERKMQLITNIFLLISFLFLNNINFTLTLQYQTNIYVRSSSCYNETCYNKISDYANSPLVECSYL